MVIRNAKFSFVFIAGLVIFFQNCSQPGAIQTTDLSTYSNLDDQNLKFSSESFQRQFATNANDILFVIDDSVSMNSIIDNVRQGIASLSATEFPADTKMAVTYMSPALFSDFDGRILFDQSWYSLAVHTPGYLNLVNQASIAKFLAVPKSKDDKSNDQFILSGCEQEWFSPNEKNLSQQSCLQAAMQAPYYPVGAEAGVVSLYQLLEKKNQTRVALFRPHAKVNIIFVSDTHEPGSNYWGKSGALKKQYTLAEISNQILKNSPLISSIKFSGIVPVPYVGHSALQGLRVLGDIPRNESEAQIGGEGLNDFSYIPYIKGTGGLVTQPISEDWSALTNELVKDSAEVGNLVVQTNHPVKELVAVKVNGVNLDLDLVSLSDDGTVLNIQYNQKGIFDYKIQIDYLY